MAEIIDARPSNGKAPSSDFALVTPTDFGFPFQPYEIQLELMRHLFEAVEQGKVAILESPTGTGKSLSIICASLSWIRNNRGRVNDSAMATMLESLKKSLGDEPEWVLQQEVERKRQDLVEHEEELERRLQEIRTKEKLDAERDKAMRLREDRPRKKQKRNADSDLSDEEFAPEAAEGRRPAATGSDLSSSVLAMLDKYRGPAPKHRVEVDEEPDVQKILFTSRTHSQLSQFVGEIRKTRFAHGLRAVALGSRANLCINDDVRRASAGSLEALNEACTELQKSEKDKRCQFLPPVDDPERMIDFRDHALSSIRDIEELAELGRKLGCCPYYGSRAAVRQAQLVTMPYNLLMQKTARNALNLSIKGHVVVIDEAHNLIDNLLGIYTIAVSSGALIKARGALNTYLAKFQSRLKGTNSSHLKQLVRVFDRLTVFCDEWQKTATAPNGHREDMKTVNEILAATKVLDQVNMHELNAYLDESKIIRKVAGYAEKAAKDEAGAGAGKPPRASQNRSAFLNAFYRIQGFLLSLANADDDGRVLISLEKAEGRPSTVALKYQLLNPSEHFKDIVNEARSVVLAGGTMAPISDFRDQLFSYVGPDRLSIFSCTHIVSREHIFARTVSLGPSGQKLDLRFESRGNVKMLDDFGQALNNICSIVTKGVVCFCPSYALLDTLVKRWSESGIWARLCQKKKVFQEPKLTSEVDAVLAEYAEAVEKRPGGGLLLSVVGAKLSEGINFSNDLCRAVVVIGIPYPNANSPELKERMRYVDNLRKGSGAGQQLYANLAFKAVNQSIGRSIRHINDWSAIILLDCRYASASSKAKLPSWITDGLEDAPTFGALVKGLAGFYKRRSTTVIPA